MAELDGWRNEHKYVIDSFLKTLNRQTDRYVLKGGTALMECYHLNRFSEDIDLEAVPEVRNTGKAI